jgi:hypothetical protein
MAERRLVAVGDSISPDVFQLGSFLRELHEALGEGQSLGQLAALCASDDERLRMYRGSYLLAMCGLAQEA